MIKKILTVFFILLLTSQVYGLVLKPSSGLKEKRFPAEAPSYKADKLLKSRYYRRLSAFLNDRYPYRSPLIRAKNWVDYYIFSTSPSEKVLIGRDGWLYLHSGVKSYLRRDCEKKEQAENLARVLKKMEVKLESAGKKFYFIVAPNKATIYPEYVGFKVPQSSCSKSFYELFLQALEKYPLRGFIRLDRLLLQSKKGSPLYFRTGTHWNSHGSAIASKAILERLSTSEKKFAMPEIKFEPFETPRDLTMIWGLDVKEKAEIASITKRRSKIKTRKLPPLANGWPRLKLTATSKRGTPLLPRTVIYRDSFMTMPLIFIDGAFKEIDALWTRVVPVGAKIDFAVLKDSKIIMLEVVERDLDKLHIRIRALQKALGDSGRNKNITLKSALARDS